MAITENEKLYKRYKNRAGILTDNNTETEASLMQAYQDERKVNEARQSNEADYQAANQYLQQQQVADNQRVLSLQDVAMKYLPHSMRGYQGLGVGKAVAQNVKQRYDQQIKDIGTAYDTKRQDVYSAYKASADQIGLAEDAVRQTAETNAATIDQGNIAYVGNAIKTLADGGATPEEIYAELLKYKDIDFGGYNKEYNEWLKQYKAEVEERKEVTQSVDKGKKGIWDLLEKWAKAYEASNAANRV